MLVELVVENYAVVERLRVRFHRGLNLLTGETGSGKSIVVDALSLLLGERASSEVVRSGAETARVSGIFEVAGPAQLKTLLSAAGLEAEDGELLIEREVSAGGKSRAFVANRPATVGLLKDIAPFLADIHGQHDQQRLFHADAQLEALDAFAACDDLLAATAAAYGAWRDCCHELEELERGEQEKLRLLDLWTFQRKEIETAAPKAGEDTELERERRILQNLTRLQEAAGAAFAALYDSPSSAMSQMRAAIRRVEELCRIDSSVENVLESLRPAEIAVEEAALVLRDYLGRLEADPGRLDEVESRLAALDRLKRKYGATLSDVLRYLEEVREQINRVEHSEERRVVLRRRQQELAAAYSEAAGRLTGRRTEAARRLEKRVETELAGLAMERTAFRVVLSPAAWSEHGSDGAAFLVSPNIGEEPRPLDKVASGGELSRIALAIKTCLSEQAGASNPAKTLPPRTLVFDEIDAGVGGKAAETVGRRLRQLAAANQVLCVTHLPQIAGFADHHFFVEKKVSGGRTIAVMHELDPSARVREIGRMLSGERLTPEALKNAEKLIALSRR